MFVSIRDDKWECMHQDVQASTCWDLRKGLYTLINTPIDFTPILYLM